MTKLSLRQLYASYAPKVLALLAEDESARAVFGDDIADQFKVYKKAEDKDIVFEQSIMPLFMGKLYPSAQKSSAIAAWLCKAYLNHRHNGKPILAEDFYKVAENLKYFHALKNSNSLPHEQRDLLSYQTYQELLDVLKPFDEKRSAKEAAETFRKLTPQQKEIIQKETTVLYDGIEGQIVIPHTPRASQFWGSNTKWCIAGKETGSYFPDYNRRSPIVMIIPKGLQDQKIALVEKILYNAEDKQTKGLPEAHFDLFQKMLASHPTDIARDLKALINPDDLKISKPTIKKEDDPIVDPSIPPEWQGHLRQIVNDAIYQRPLTSVPSSLLRNKTFMLAAVMHNCEPFQIQNSGALKYAAPKLQADKEVIIAAVKQNDWALYYASPALRADKEVVMAAVTRSGEALYFATPALQADKEVVLAAIAQNGLALDYASYTLRADKEVVMAAVTQSVLALQYASAELWGDKEVIMVAVTQNGCALYYASPALRADKEVVMAAVTQNVDALYHASVELRSDIAFILNCAQKNLDCLKDSLLLEAEKEAVKIKVSEQFITEGQIGKAKNILMRHHQSTWGAAQKQFGDSLEGIDSLISQIKDKMSDKVRANYAVLCEAVAEKTGPNSQKLKLM